MTARRTINKKAAALFLLVVFFSLPYVAGAASEACPDDPNATPGTVCIGNPLPVNTPGELVLKGFQGFAGIIGLVAIAFIVFNGFKLVVSFGNEETIEAGRNGLKWSVLGFMAALLSFTGISGVSKLLGYDPGAQGDPDHIVNVIRLPGKTELESGSFVDVMNFIMINFLGLLGFATTLMIIYYGFKYVYSAGNEEAIEEAKKGLRWSLLGLILTLLAFTIISSVRTYLIRGV